MKAYQMSEKEGDPINVAAAGLQWRNACGHHVRPFAAMVGEAGTFLAHDHI